MRRLSQLVSLLIFSIIANSSALGFGPVVHAAPTAQEGDPTIVAVGDISNCSNEEDWETASLVDGIPGPILLLGDNAYEVGSLQEYQECFDPPWGRFKDRIHPVPGNHEYGSGNANGYFAYFGDAASPSEPGCRTDCKGYYSFNVGSWHIIALNSEIDQAADSPQLQWLRADLAANQTPCTLAYWHKPWFSSGRSQHSAGGDFWQVLYDYGADVVLVGHDHVYERFAPQNIAGQVEPERGIREFIVGTGGAEQRDFWFIQPNSEARNSETFGVLKMTLHPTSYDWEFIPIARQSFRDSGSANCVTASGEPPVAAPVEPTTVADPGTTTTNTTTTDTTTATAAPAPTTASVPADGLDYTVQAGDTVSLIALRYGLNWQTVAAANGLTDPYIIEIGQVLRLPGAQGVVSAPTTAPSSTTVIQPTATPNPVTAPANTGGSTRSYTVKEGDTLYGIAIRNNTTWQALAAANGLSENSLLQIGQVLSLPGQADAPASVIPTATPAAATAAPTAAETTSDATYTVATGDTLISIATRFGVNWQTLIDLNGLPANGALQVGQTLRLR